MKNLCQFQTLAGVFSRALVVVAVIIVLPKSTIASWPPQGWAYWLQDISLATLEQESPDVAVIDYSSTGGADGEWTAEQISQLKNAGTTVLAYLSIGEAENYRYYWQESWTKTPPGWLGPLNPDWPGNYKVRYWMPEWKAILYGTAEGADESYFDRVLDQGFDGVYLDIIDAYYYWSSEAPSDQRFTDAADSMVALLSHLDEYAASRGHDQMLIIPQNGEWLADDCTASPFRNLYFQTIDGIAVEDLFCPGSLDENNPWSPRYEDKEPVDNVLDAGKTVLSVEYLTTQSLINQYLSAAGEAGYIPLATVRELNVYNYNGPAINVDETADPAMPAGPILRAYPNPFNSSVHVLLEGLPKGSVPLELFDMTGARVWRVMLPVSAEGRAQTVIDAHSLASGVYLLRASGATRRITLLR